VRESVIEGAGVVGGAQHLIEGRMEVADGFSPFVEIAGSVIDFDTAVDSCEALPMASLSVVRKESELASTETM